MPRGGPRVTGAGPVRGRRLAAAAVGATAAAAMPLFLLGALAVQVRADLGFSEAGLGAAIALFFIVSAVSGPFVRRIIERLGSFRGVLATCVLAALALASVALLVDGYAGLLGAMALGGAGQAFGQPSANGLLSRGLAGRREGTAFGVKQAAVPLASLLAGATVPLIALTVGWRWAYGLVAVVVLAVPALVPRHSPASAPRPRTGAGPVPPTMAWLALAGVFAAAPTMALGSFLVEAAVDRGLGASTAGLLLVYGSLVSIAVRLAIGLRIDARPFPPMRAMAGMMAAGSLGFVLLALGQGAAALVAATTIAFGVGWAWNGLMDLSVVRLNRDRPAAGTSTFLSLFFVGAAIGPLGFGAIVEAAGFAAAWLAAAGLLLCAAGCVAQAVRLAPSPLATAARGT